MIASQVKNYLERASWIRKMFEEGAKLKAQHGADKVCDFSLGNPDVPPPPEVRKALKEILAEDRPELHAYMPNAGFPFAREAMAEKVSREQGLRVSPEEVILTCGAAGGLNIIFKALLEPGEEVVFPAPFFVEYGFYVENHRGVPKPIPTKPDFTLDFEALDRAITPKTKALLINSPNNPTGRLYSEKDLADLAKLLKEKSRILGRPVYLVSDEPYRNLVFDGLKVPSVFKYYAESFVVSSFSKELSLPGERIGFVVVHPEMENKAEILAAMILANRILGFVNAPAFAQRLAAKCARALVDVSIYERRRNLFCEILDEAGLEYVKPEGAFYLFPKTPIDDVEFCKLLQEELILAVPGRGFGGPGHIRLAFCVDESIIERSRERFIRAVQKARERRS